MLFERIIDSFTAHTLVLRGDFESWKYSLRQARQKNPCAAILDLVFGDNLFARRVPSIFDIIQIGNASLLVANVTGKASLYAIAELLIVLFLH